MHQIRPVDRVRLPSLKGIFLSLLLTAPLGLGLPYFVGLFSEDMYGFVLLLLLLSPSVWVSTLLMQLIQQRPAAPGISIAAGCAAPLAGLFLMGVLFLSVEEACKRWSIGCNPYAAWPGAILIWGIIVITSLWGAQVIPGDEHY
jgi:hypothetical protein